MILDACSCNSFTSLIVTAAQFKIRTFKVCSALETTALLITLAQSPKEGAIICSVFK
jgi:hypothetical protein